MDTNKLLAKHHIWEGCRSTVYDDANGNPIKQSVYVKGNPTIGIGRNLTNPLSEAAIEFLWNESVQEAFANASCFVWFKDLSEPRQLAITDMVFNMGYEKLLTFKQFLGYMEVHDYESAAYDLKTTAWAAQVKGRAAYLIEAIRMGTWP